MNLHLSYIFTHMILTICTIFLYITACRGGPHERRLIKDLLHDYDPYERPSANDSEPLKVEFMITLQQIIDVHEKNQMINTNLWMTMLWSDYKLQWNPAEYGNVTELRLPQKLLWKPDILMYNSVDPSFDGSWPVNIVIYSDGTVTQLPPGIFTSSCPINIRWFPFDDQACLLKFGSWTYDGTKIDLQILGGATSGSIDGYSQSGEWNLIGFPAKRNVVLYDCCPDNPYYDLTFSIEIRRRKLYYLVNIVCPCMMLAALTLLTFCIPCDAGEKISFAFPAHRNIQKYDCCPETYIDITFIINIRRRMLFFVHFLVGPCALLSMLTLVIFMLPSDSAEKVSFGVTILLSLTVFLLLVAEALPATSDAVPLIALYFACVMLLNAASVVFNVVVLSYHHRSSETHVMPHWIKRGMCGWLAWALRVKRPGHEITSRRLSSGKPLNNGDIELVNYTSQNGHTTHCSEPKQNGHQNGCHTRLLTSEDTSSLPSSPILHGLDLTSHKLKINARTLATEFSPTRLELRHILAELRFLTNKFKDKEAEEKITADWKFAATVLDRLMLWSFMFLTIAATMAILFTAPNIFSPEVGIQ